MTAQKARTGKTNLRPAPVPRTFQKSPASQPEVSKEPRKLGRPTEHDEPMSKVTVWLADRQLAYMDGRTIEHRQGKAAHGDGWKSLSRSHIIRALVDAFEDAEIDVTKLASSDELRALLAERLRSQEDAGNIS
jgi:hypothetical protein